MDDLQPETLALPSGPARVEWRRSARARRVSLRIDPTGGAVVVTLPIRATRKAGMALLMGHADWVSDRLAALPVSAAVRGRRRCKPKGSSSVPRVCGVTVRVRPCSVGCCWQGAWCWRWPERRVWRRWLRAAGAGAGVACE